MSRPHPDKMSFLEHLEELRVRLVHVALALCVGFGLCWGFREEIFHFLTEPLRYAFPDIKFIFTGPSEALLLYMKMSFFVGIFVAAPYILWQVWAFIAPGLYPHEKGYVYPFIFFGTLFFLGGAAFGHFYLFRVTFSFLGAFGGADMTFMPKVDEYFSFYSWFLLGLGLVFQTPDHHLRALPHRDRHPRLPLRNFKYAVLAAFVVSAVLTPSTDMVTQTLLALPILVLYLLGTLVAFLFGRKRERPEEVSAEARS